MSDAFHDLGGRPAGPIDRAEHDPSFWDRRVDAMQQLMSDPRRRFWRSDEFRLAVETLEPDEYRRLRYYERWITALSRLLVKKGVLTQDEIRSRMDLISKSRA